MIAEETVIRTARADDEIRAGEKLLAEMEEAVGRGELPNIRDAFGRTLAPRLAVAVIRAHVGEKRAELAALSIQAWREADGSVVAKAGPLEPKS